MSAGDAHILTINAGSSSVKYALFAHATGARVHDGQIEGLGVGGLSHEQALRQVMAQIGPARVIAVGHRIVHGGVRFTAPVRIDDEVMSAMAALEPLAPLHQPHNLAPIRMIRKLMPALPQVACFDTAFHANQAWEERAFALPRALTHEGVRRYGFHGISYDFIASRLKEIAPDLARGKVVVAHLGNGASLCAIDNGRSVASTMGFTAVDGLVMGTRSGALDPGVLIYLMDQHGLDARGLEELIYKKSGLLGVSGISSDMRALRASDASEAAQAIRLFIHRILREIGALAAVMGGIDGIVFTAGIGENDAATRTEVVAGCRWLGAMIDPAKNAAGDTDISAPGSRIRVLRIPTDEELNIAISTIALTQGALA